MLVISCENGIFALQISYHSMYAIVKIAGQQFKVAKDQKLFVHRLANKQGEKVCFDQVYLLDDGKNVDVGAPAITGASVEAKVVNHLKGDKVIVFKKKRRKGYRVKNGHRQALTELVIEKITPSDSKTKKPETVANTSGETKKATSVKKTVKKGSLEPKEDIKNFSSMTVAQLKAEAKAKRIQVISSMKKADIIAALSKQSK